MEQRISLITLGVRDVKKARAFYDALGWKAASEDFPDTLIPYNLSGFALGLYGWDALAEDAQVPAEGTGFRGVTLAYNVRTKEEVSTVLAEAAQAGGAIVKPAQDVFWGGHSGYFSDSDGHLWEVAYNPFSPLGTDGAFQWGGAE
ncbi:MAG: VOC family protein [Rhodospirillales bacterium]|nr:VOC family protein [Rhodospirillales bacterium]MCB9995361.1 VOC family protein [Rhodospirillales bacterium]